MIPEKQEAQKPPEPEHGHRSSDDNHENDGCEPLELSVPEFGLKLGGLALLVGSAALVWIFTADPEFRERYSRFLYAYGAIAGIGVLIFVAEIIKEYGDVILIGSLVIGVCVALFSFLGPAAAIIIILLVLIYLK